MTTHPGDPALLCSLLVTAFTVLYGWRLLACWGRAKFAQDDAGSGRLLIP